MTVDTILDEIVNILNLPASEGGPRSVNDAFRAQKDIPGAVTTFDRGFVTYLEDTPNDQAAPGEVYRFGVVNTYLNVFITIAVASADTPQDKAWPRARAYRQPTLDILNRKLNINNGETVQLWGQPRAQMLNIGVKAQKFEGIGFVVPLWWQSERPYPD